VLEVAADDGGIQAVAGNLGMLAQQVTGCRFPHGMVAAAMNSMVPTGELEERTDASRMVVHGASVGPRCDWLIHLKVSP